ncbi:M20/M25/M40 family metallo-hydrolase [Streptomyces sp. NBC_00053]|uniref:M20/M25/M40 family metallo-hydrolase n=1 Tax=unclassified Streptomyces TaxID=2593676 RepID=UPI0022538929|nr:MULTISPECIES: M20/M25/M40 family metallo-hydrolase [unclassified Streptomyces]MCX4393365.1 M20/M25/M40 family metallo-hydrolase [Streptomyces sp. NBC_01767]MCX5105308.1 M20/M25/M40 family metallo-hydrolase [Streptomyces sp. NBC_00439]MCX5503759.1 M20/M25/M40 family metallo-hydrolase [Streptomyces sp. NBC_00052]MCX5547706.1 M20/M25/M40 family metallo-hydrolase [Streptomyces sp. NBC_00051]WSC27157.1 M20/M25/M40 family metallo-hydrolase [Streptomyces sp. NBC_01768]
MTSRRSLPRLAAAVVGVSLTLSAVPAATADTRLPAAPTVSEQQVMPHLRALQRIADRNGGNRAHGTKGYAESVAYVKRALDRAGFRTKLVPFTHDGATGNSLIADWPGGDPDHVLMTGAHLDSVKEGPGINDNGSGSAAVLATALQVAKTGLKPERHLRFAWWGAEEPGLIGSAEYVRKLSAAERRRIDVYLNFDQAGSRNTRQWLVIHDDEHGETEAQQAFEAWFAERSIPTFDIGVGGSDHESFGNAGIPSSGFSTGISDCIHEACDDLSNVDPKTERTSTDAIVGVLWKLAATTPRH